MMKKITICIVMALLCLNFWTFAQSKDLGGLKPGDTLGILHINRFYHPQTKAIKPLISTAINGREIILDFWATWCGTCISKFNYLQELQRKFADRVLIVLANTSLRDTDEKVSAFMSTYYQQNPGFELSYSFRDKKLNLLFPSRALPHYVWIGSDGIVKAITGWEDLTTANIQKFVDREPLSLKVKEW